MAVHLPCYRYIRYEDAESIHFPTISNDDRNNIPVDTLVWVLLSKGKQKVPKLYKRARTLESEPDAEGRINVKYASGSTYRVRRLRLVPVPENLSQTILVAAETNDYRRMSIVHTLKEDHFIGECNSVCGFKTRKGFVLVQRNSLRSRNCKMC